MGAPERAPSLSVALCTYNGASFLAEQLSSLSAQEVLPDELVIGDDLSTDQTLDIIAAFRATCPFPVRVIRNERRLGYRANFLNVAQACKSELIAFCDQDDVWLPGKVARCKVMFEDPDVFLVAHGFDIVDINLGSPMRAGPLEDRVFAAGERRREPNAPGFTQVFRRELLEICDPRLRPLDPTKPTELLAHDQWVEFIADALGKSYFVCDNLALYRQHGSNLYGAFLTGPGLSIFSRIYKNANREYFGMISEVARGKAEILSGISTDRYRGRADVLENMASAHRYWRKVSQINAGRAAIYSDARWLSRCYALIKAISLGAYGGPPSVGLKALFRDFLAGVAFPRSEPPPAT